MITRHRNWRIGLTNPQFSLIYLYQILPVRSVNPDTTIAFATRLRATEAERLEAAIEETDWSKATIVRRAVRYYIRKNPDRILALYPENSTERFLMEMMD